MQTQQNLKRDIITTLDGLPLDGLTLLAEFATFLELKFKNQLNDGGLTGSVRSNARSNQPNPPVEEPFLPADIETLVAQIQATPLNPANFKSGSGHLAEHLAELPHAPNPDFEVEQWNAQWDMIEAQMKHDQPNSHAPRPTKQGATYEHRLAARRQRKVHHG